MKRGVTLVLAVVVATAAAVLPAAAAVRAPGHVRRLPAAERAAVRLAHHDGMATGIGVVDTATGAVYTAGQANRLFASASVVKTLIATRLILRGKLHGTDRALAHKMIVASDNDAAQQLYPQAGGDRLVPDLERHYHLSGLGAAPLRPHVWGATRLTAAGMAEFYAAVRTDHRVWPWLSRAMHAYEPTSSEGEPNSFGVAAAAPRSAVKNGWVLDVEPDTPRRAQINSTGFVDHDRYAVAIFTRGPTSDYYRAGERVVTDEAELVMPHGHLTPLPRPHVQALSMHRGKRGDRVTIRGTHFGAVRAVYFGRRAARLVRAGRRRLQVIVPRHAAGSVAVTAAGIYGTSRPTPADRFRYVPR